MAFRKLANGERRGRPSMCQCYCMCM